MKTRYTLEKALQLLKNKEIKRFAGFHNFITYTLELRDGEVKCYDKDSRECSIIPDIEWRKVKEYQEVDFNVAFEMWLQEKKDIYCELDGITYYYGCRESYLENLEGAGVTREEIKEGKWFIIDIYGVDPTVIGK